MYLQKKVSPVIGIVIIVALLLLVSGAIFGLQITTRGNTAILSKLSSIGLREAAKGLSKNLTLNTPNIWIPGSNSVNKIDVLSGEISGPYDLHPVSPSDTAYKMGGAVDIDGNFWVSERYNAYYSNKITKLSPSGSSLGTFTLDYNATGIAADISGNVWVATDNGVVKVSSAGIVLGTYDSGHYENLAVDYFGNVWAVSGHEYILKITPSGGTVRYYLAIGDTQGIAIDVLSNVWVATYSAVVKVSPSGNVIGSYGSGNFRGIAVDASGNIWAAKFENGAHKVFKFSPDGSPLGNYDVGNQASGVSVDSNNNIWVSSTDGNVVKLSSAGVQLGTYNVNAGQALGDFTGFALAQLITPHTILGRYIFYNNSSWDNNNAGINTNDDAAIAIDKQALLPGGTATFANYTSYSKGINGIMIDIQNLPGGAVLSASDFEFKVGNTNNPTTWTNAPPPTAIQVRDKGSGIYRVTIVWPDNTIQKQWLQVKVLANTNTRLLQPDVFYFGSAIGDTGNSSTDAKVNATDQILARNNPRTIINPAPVDFPYDFDRDKKVNATDELIARSNQTQFATALKLIIVPNP